MATFNFTENAKMALAYAQEEAINMKHRHDRVRSMCSWGSCVLAGSVPVC